MIWRVAAIPVLAVLGVLAWAHWPAWPLPDAAVADRVVVKKAERRLELYRDGERLRAYPVALGWDPVTPKRHEGDGRTPEGEYVIDYRKPDSAFHRALHVSYPGPADRAWADERGLDPGGLIMIHGLSADRAPLGRLHRFSDWTDGCIAVTNQEIEEIWRVVPDGTPIRIEP